MPQTPVAELFPREEISRHAGLMAALDRRGMAFVRRGQQLRHARHGLLRLPLRRLHRGELDGLATLLERPRRELAGGSAVTLDHPLDGELPAVVTRHRPGAWRAAEQAVSHEDRAERIAAALLPRNRQLQV